MNRCFFRAVRWVVLLSSLLPVVFTACNRLYEGAPIADAGTAAKFAVWIGGAFVLFRLLGRLGDKAESAGEKQVAFIDALPDRWIDRAIFGSAALSIFLELAMIRWQTSEYMVLTFYKNFCLLACFAGLGLGYALAERRSIALIAVIPLFVWQLIALRTALFLRPFGTHTQHIQNSLLHAGYITEQVDTGMPMAKGPLQYALIYAFLAILFALTALIFIPVGQLCGRTMMRRRNLRAYGLNLLGSLAGVVMVQAVSYLWAPPTVWFVIVACMLVPFIAFDQRALTRTFAAAAVMVVLLATPVSHTLLQIYSPYQLVEGRRTSYGQLKVSAAGTSYQDIYNLAFSNANRESDPFLRAAAGYYELPYHVYPDPADVVIVGSGTGNDVAAALRMGAGRIDAVEIDPAIVLLGQAYHPERPYQDPRVEIHVNDARTFLRNTERQYDMIVYGYLDSHTLLSHASTVRVDSFVYTLEAFREARKRLKKDGMMSLSFTVNHPGIQKKIYTMLTDVFDGRPPLCIHSPHDDGVTYLSGNSGPVAIEPELIASLGLSDYTERVSDPAVEADISTDDWPFIYMPRRVYPFSHWGMFAVVLLISAAFITNFTTERPQFSHTSFFFLGAGFMLVETKGITELGLTFGNTWHVVGFIIAGVLVMAFLANALVGILHIRRPHIPFVLLLLSLALGWWFSWQGGASSTLLGRMVTLGVLTVPVFFSGIIFSTMLSASRGIAGVMSLNIMGAMLGGLLEYNSMYFGYRFLYLLAMALYLAAFIAYLAAPRTTRTGSPQVDPGPTGDSN